MTTTSLPPGGAAAQDAGPGLAAVAADLRRLRQRARSGIWIEALGAVALLLVAFALPSFLTDRGLRLEWFYRAALLASFVVVLVRVLQRRLWRPLQVPLGDEEMALAVERRAPAVREALISSLQFERALHDGRTRADSPELMRAVLADVQARAAAIPFAAAIDAARVRRYLGGIGVAVAFFGGWAALDAGSLGLWARRNLALSNVDWPRYTQLAFADAGDGVRVPQGDALTIRVAARGEDPEQVFVDYAYRGGERGTEPMSRTGDGEFTLTLDAVVEDLVLTARGGDALPVELRVTVVERPRLEGIELRVTYPAYMERDAEVVPSTESELRLPRGAKVAVAGRSHKPIDEAFLLVGNERKLPLQPAADGHGFAGEFAPEASGLVTLDVIDRDRLGALAPTRLQLRVGDDKPPLLEFRLRGISAMVTTHARIPGELRAKDDFGLRELAASLRAVADAPADGKPAAEAPNAPDAPFEPVQALFAAALPRSALRHETAASVDLAQWNPVADEASEQNRIRPGMLVSLRFAAKDNFGPGEPHTGFTETMTFRVVTRDKLLEELRRRQVEQRQELQRILDEERQALLELREIASPQQAGDRRPLVVARLKALVRQQQALGRRVAFVGESYQRILWEYENNRLIEANKVRQIESLVPQPLAALAKASFPATSRLVEAFATTSQDAARAEAVAGYEDIERRITAILREMEQAESLAAILEDLRLVIQMQDSALQDVEKRSRAAEEGLFGKPKDAPKDPPKDPDKK